MSKLALIAVPFFTTDKHFFLAEQTMKSVASSHELIKIAVVNKLGEGEVERDWIKANFDRVEFNDQNILARAWNKGMRLAFSQGAEYALLINLDIILHPSCIDNLVSCAKENPSAFMWSASSHASLDELESVTFDSSTVLGADCSCYMVDNKLLRDAGEFDERFAPAYHEDSDMIYRITLLGGSCLISRASHFYHFNRGTVKGWALAKQTEAMNKLQELMDKNRAFYERKWGGGPGQEKFTKPFNGLES
ncbi:MAG: hypothetical protein DCC75_04995 [Proteobacteria bacterium]|nr:MAG: hypothetical protein DCC75_04995 [Pseudomonadota bacterium]